MILCKPWDGKDLKGVWVVTYKIDGVRAISDGQNVTSRSGKPLYNLDHLADTFTDAEIFLGNFKTTIEAVRSKNVAKEILPEHVYSFDPIDERLYAHAVMIDPPVDTIKKSFNLAVYQGYEGIVLKQKDRWIKIKAHETFDVPCLDFLEGTGKYTGSLGKVDTPLGLVGTGFSDEEREWFWKFRPYGLIIEVECNRLTESGFFRHAAFKHIRWDKS